MSHKKLYILTSVVLLVLFRLNAVAQRQTRPVGVYPGRVSENFAPELFKDDTNRNIAYHRKVTQSSAYDFSHTAQLLTDGQIDEHMPMMVSVTTPDGLVDLRERESSFDGNEWTNTIVRGSDTWISYSWYPQEYAAERLVLTGFVACEESVACDHYEIMCELSEDGIHWRKVSELIGDGLPGKAVNGRAYADPNKNDGEKTLPVRMLNLSMQFDDHAVFSYLRVSMCANGVVYWALNEMVIMDGGREGAFSLSSDAFHSSWITTGKGKEWACVDLGTNAEIDSLNISWCKVAESGELQVSSDSTDWQTVASWEDGHAPRRVDMKGNARFVRLVVNSDKENTPCIVNEIEVWGSGGVSAVEKAEEGWVDNRFSLSGGHWRLSPELNDMYEKSEIHHPDYNDSSWLVATVPGTVLMSYVNAEAVVNPNYDADMLMISDSFFNRNFVYRRTFCVPDDMKGHRVVLCLDGINHKAVVKVNGQEVGTMKGAFVRGQYDITKVLREGTNVLTITVLPPPNHGAVKLKNDISTDYNGGPLGADNPTFHATAGWDWISTVRGRDIGVWNDVYLKAVDDIVLSDPYVETDMQWGDTLLTITPHVFIRNYTGHAVSGMLKGRIGDVEFSKLVTIGPSAEQEIIFQPADFPQLSGQRMRLWWPNGMGEPYLYDASYEFNSALSTLEYKVGMRYLEYEDTKSQLKIWVNGKRFVPRGGNWGFSEHNLCYKKREYDIAVGYHRDMNMNCIRNWVGQTGDEELYAACDSLGIMVWQDFWLANPSDGPDPTDEDMFMQNAYDYVRRIRKHSSVMLYCGRNEGYPPENLDKALRACVDNLSHGTLYIPNSADEGVSGHGPYCLVPVKMLFSLQDNKLHTERGMPCVMTIESLSRMLKPENRWQSGKVWGQHDFTLKGAQRGETFLQEMERRFGRVDNVEDFCSLAQWINYDGYRAMFESTNIKRQGLLIWMSHPCWPSMTWQTYDYFFEPTAAFFGAKSACEPVHVQWDERTEYVDVVNVSGKNRNLVLYKEIRDISGNIVKRDSIEFSVRGDETRHCSPVEFPDDSSVFFLRLMLKDADTNDVVSRNCYVRVADGNYRPLLALPRPTVTVKSVREGTTLHVKVDNKDNTPALLVRLKLVDEQGQEVLPVRFSDNYFHLMPHEQREITVGWNAEDCSGNPIIHVVLQ